VVGGQEIKPIVTDPGGKAWNRRGGAARAGGLAWVEPAQLRSGVADGLPDGIAVGELAGDHREENTIT